MSLLGVTTFEQPYLNNLTTLLNRLAQTALLRMVGWRSITIHWPSKFGRFSMGQDFPLNLGLPHSSMLSTCTINLSTRLPARLRLKDGTIANRMLHTSKLLVPVYASNALAHNGANWIVMISPEFFWGTLQRTRIPCTSIPRQEFSNRVKTWYLQCSCPPAAQLLYDLGLEAKSDFVSINGILLPTPIGTISLVNVPWPPTPPVQSKKAWTPPPLCLFVLLPLRMMEAPTPIMAHAA